MANRKTKKRKKNTSVLFHILYTCLLLALFTCLAGLYLHSRRLNQQEAELREAIIQKEQAASDSWIGGAENAFDAIEDGTDAGDADKDEKNDEIATKGDAEDNLLKDSSDASDKTVSDSDKEEN